MTALESVKAEKSEKEEMDALLEEMKNLSEQCGRLGLEKEQVWAQIVAQAEAAEASFAEISKLLDEAGMAPACDKCSQEPDVEGWRALVERVRMLAGRGAPRQRAPFVQMPALSAGGKELVPLLTDATGKILLRLRIRDVLDEQIRASADKCGLSIADWVRSRLTQCARDEEKGK